MLEMDLIGWVTLFVLAGAVLYVASTFATKKKLDMQDLLSCAAGAASIPCGVDLFWCALNPFHLVEKVAPDGHTILYTGVISIGQLHRVDMAIAALSLLFLGVAAVVIPFN